MSPIGKDEFEEVANGRIVLRGRAERALVRGSLSYYTLTDEDDAGTWGWTPDISVQEVQTQLPPDSALWTICLLVQRYVHKD